MACDFLYSEVQKQAWELYTFSDYNLPLGREIRKGEEEGHCLIYNN